MMQSSSPASKSLASLLTRWLVLAFVLFAMVLIWQSYSLSAKSVARERERSIEQTQQVLENQIQMRLSHIQTNQDILSASQQLQSQLYASEPSERLDEWFFDIENKYPDAAASFAFIEKKGALYWEDGKSYFYGLSKKDIQALIARLHFPGRWHIEVLDAPGLPSVLLRQVPIIYQQNGQLVGYLYVALVLNDNLAWLQRYDDAANSRSLFLFNDDHLLAHSAHVHQHFLLQVAQARNEPQEGILGDYLLSKVTMPFYRGQQLDERLELWSLTPNSALLALNKHLLRSILITLLLLLPLIALCFILIRRKVRKALSPLMSYTQAVASGSGCHFAGSDVQEFELFGNTLAKNLQTLVEKEHSIRALFDSSPSPIVVWNQACEVERMNPIAKRCFLRAETESENYQQLNSQLADDLAFALSGKAIEGVQCQLLGRNYCWNLAPLLIDGEVRLVIGQCADVSEMVEAQALNRQARKSAEEANEAKSQFLAKISHEIRTPLNGILGMGQILREGLRDPLQVEQMNIINQSGEHLLSLLNEVLDFSAIEHGALGVELSEFNLAEVITPLCDLYQPICQRKNLNFVLQSAVAHDVRIRSDKNKLNQILYNLINNAVKFTEKGEVCLSIAMESSKQGLELILQVKDSGVGISPEQQARIFEPFLQLEQSNAMYAGGSGLGLAIVKKIVEQLQGHIELRSEQGKGSSFYIRFGIERVAELHHISIEPEEIDIQALAGLEVLLVEDNRTNGLVMKALCDKHRIVCHWADDATQALHLLKQRHFDVIIVDHQMPGMCGVELTHLLREQLKLEIPIIACTADVQKITNERFMQAGANEVLLKPLREKELILALAEYQLSA